MADPEQIYQEVLSEEQGKGVTPAVAEGRAKSARARAEHGSPHPKEPKWWPGAQPHLEGGDGAAEAPAETEEEAPAAEAPAEEATADVQADEVEPEAPAAEPEPATEQPVAPAAAGTTAPAPQSVPQEPAAAAQPTAAAQPAAAATATQTVVPKTTGVSHGTTTGTRLRPEDEVATDAQFEGQKAMYERRKLIDDLVASGVPQVTAYETDRPRSPWLAVLYLLIPLIAIFVIATNDDGTEEEAGATETETTAPDDGGNGGGGVSTTLVAANIEWDTETLTFKANEESALTLENQDTTIHNMSIYPDEQAAESQSDPLFKGEDVEAGASAEYTIDPLDKGTYTFICDYHINMIGEVQVQ